MNDETWPFTGPDSDSGQWQTDGTPSHLVSDTPTKWECNVMQGRIGPITDIDHEGFAIYGSMPKPDGPNIGARLCYDTTCTNCGKRFAAGHMFTAELAPDMAGTFHHTDCDDPKLEREK